MAVCSSGLPENHLLSRRGGLDRCFTQKMTIQQRISHKQRPQVGENIFNHETRKPDVGQTFQSAGSRNFPVPCFQLRAVGQVRTRAVSRMNGRLESRPTGRLESLPYESALSVFFAFSAVKKIPVFFLGGDARPQPDLLPQEKGRAFTRFYYSIAVWLIL